MLMGYKRRPARVVKTKTSVSDFTELPKPFVLYILDQIIPQLQMLVWKGYGLGDLNIEYHPDDSQVVVTFTILDPKPADEIELLYEVEVIEMEEL